MPFANVEGIQQQLLPALRSEGVEPDEIDIVFLTHLHPDHVGWNVQWQGDDARLTFPKARYITSQADWAMVEGILSANPAGAGYVREQLLPLQTQGVLALIEGETLLADGLYAIPTPGHTPGHMSLLVESGEERLLILGDAFYHPLQLAELSHHFATDADPATANSTRQSLLARIEAEDLIITACHFPYPGFGRVRLADGVRYWEALSVT
jgi:glyoxylase-like metal-dependent hydrolase (beta-lactamase superfamily II)